MNFPNIDGYGGTFVYSSNNATGTTNATAVTIVKPSASLVPGQAPPGKMLVAFELTLNQNVTFADWYSLLTTITIPADVSTSGRALNEYGYDLTAGVAEGYNLGTVNGSTISFGGGLGPVTLLGSDTQLVVLAIQ